MNVNVNIQSAGGRVGTSTPISVIGETEWGEFNKPVTVSTKSQFYAAFGAANNVFTEGCMFLLDKGVSLRVTRAGVKNLAGDAYVGTKGNYGVVPSTSTPVFSNVFRDGVYRTPVVDYFLHDRVSNLRSYEITDVTAPTAPVTYDITGISNALYQPNNDSLTLLVSVDGGLISHFSDVIANNYFGVDSTGRTKYIITLKNIQSGTTATYAYSIVNVTYSATTDITSVSLARTQSGGYANNNVVASALGLLPNIYGAATYTPALAFTPSAPSAAVGEIVVAGDMTGLHNTTNNRTISIVTTSGTATLDVFAYTYDGVAEETTITLAPSVGSIPNFVVAGEFVLAEDLVTPESITVTGTDVQDYVASATTNNFTLSGVNSGQVLTFGTPSTVNTTNTLIPFSGGQVTLAAGEEFELIVGTNTVVEIAGDYTSDLSAGLLVQLTADNINQAVTINSSSLTANTTTLVEFGSILPTTPIDGVLTYSQSSGTTSFQLEAKYAGAYSQNLQLEVVPSVSGNLNERDYRVFIGGQIMQSLRRVPLQIANNNVENWNNVFQHFNIVNYGTAAVTIDTGLYTFSAGSAPSILPSHILTQITNDAPFSEDDKVLVYLTDNPDVAVTKKFGDIAQSLNLVAYAPIPLYLDAGNEVTYKLTNNFNHPYLRLVANTINYNSKNPYSVTSTFIMSGVLIAAASAYKRERLTMDGGRYWEALGTVANSMNFNADVVSVQNNYSTTELDSLRLSGVTTVVQKRGDIFVENHVNTSIEPEISNELAMGVVRWFTHKMEQYAYDINQRQLVLSPEVWKQVFQTFRDYADFLVNAGVINRDIVIFDDIDAGSLDELVYNDKADVLNGDLKMGIEFMAFGILKSINITFVVA